MLTDDMLIAGSALIGLLVIAARAGMPDLWIEPVGDFTNTILRIGPDELTCGRWEG